MIECVPNVSDGRRLDVIEEMARAIRTSSGTKLLDCSSDRSHNRSVFTFVGEPQALEAAVLALYERAVAAIDLRTHRGVHPRLGAVDVVPFVPLAGATMADCVNLAKRVGEAVGRRFHVPVYLYEDAATRPARRQLEHIRRGQFEGLTARMAAEGWAPDFGPSVPHPTAGASAIGARPILIAFNVNLDTDQLEVAKSIASAIRQSGGGLPYVKAMGVELTERGLVQVSMNLTNFQQTSVRRAFDAVNQDAARRGVRVRESEIVGLIPEAAVSQEDAKTMLLTEPLEKKTIEARLGEY